MISCLKDIAARSGCPEPDLLENLFADFQPGNGSVIRKVIESGVVNEDAFLRHLGEQFNIAFWDGFGDVSPEGGRRLRNLFPADSARRKGIVPIEFKEDLETGESLVYLASTDPLDLEAHSMASRECNVPFFWRFATRQTIREGLQTLYGVGDESLGELIESRRTGTDLHDWEQAMVIDGDDSASMIALVNEIIRGALEQQATDIHLDPVGRDLRIRYRIDGKLKEVSTPENMGSLKTSVISRVKIMAKLDIAERRLPQDGRIHLEMDGRPIDVRVATIPSVEGESVSLRLLGQEVFTLNKVGMDPAMLAKVKNLLEMPNGIILVTGPTGSGKSTSLYAFLTQINRADTRIVTIEDPVENKLEGVVQIAVKNDIGLTFAHGLRSILRGDPDVIMVGEMRDIETAEIAIRAALTGHLVFSTLHTNDAISGVTRLVDMGVEPFLVASAVRAFIAQRLVRRLCKHCRKPYHIPASILQNHGWESNGRSADQLMIYRAAGCHQCRGTGYRGRLAIYELAMVTREMEELISSRARVGQLLDQALRDGYVPMRIYGIEKVIEGETSLEEVLSVTMTSSSLIENSLVSVIS